MNVRKFGLMLLLPVIVFAGCDRFNTMQINIPESTLRDSKLIQGATTKDLAVSTLEEFAQQIHFGCREAQGDQLILTCGELPGNGGPLHLYYSPNEFIVAYGENTPFYGERPPSRFFCELQEKLFKFYSAKFGVEKISLRALNNCAAQARS